LRVNKEAVGLRTGRIFRAIRRAFSGAREQFGFRLAQYSVQGNHIHLIAEANDRRALTRGMQGLTSRVALAVNRARGRKGRVFGDRYHARQLRTPLEVRRALLYVLRNDRKHLAEQALSLAPWRLDPCSSAHLFDGWQASCVARASKTVPRS
jgi:REP element-mobilizing transposase RayT